VINNSDRIGSFTSSEIHNLMTTGRGTYGFGAPAMTYIKEKNLERKLGRSIRPETHTRSIAWGNLIEKYVFEHKLGLEYEIHSKNTNVHPTISYWSGTKDLIVAGKKIGEIKCYEPKHFAEYVDCLISQDVEKIKKECPEEYWQMVSNAIINQVPNAEAICYMPYRSELPNIRLYASNYDDFDQWKYRFITESEDEALAWLPDGGYYTDLNRFEFEVPARDIEALTEAVKKAGTLLIERSAVVAHYEPELQSIIIE
jgi:hypothetical protein